MIYLFWMAVIFLGYTLVGYPIILLLLSLVHVKTHRKEDIRPTVSFIVAAYNEAAVMENKIKNTLELTYPRDKLEIIVALDGSNDGTPEIVSRFAFQGVKVIHLPERKGKHYAQMVARDASAGEILVFTDASVTLERDAMEKLVANFADQTIGCVSSEDRLAEEKKSRMGERSYIQFEMRLRRLESQVNSLVSVSGSFFGVRRDLCRKWHPHQSSDFFVALHAAAGGFRSIVDPECLGYYGLVRSGKAELYRKVRTIVHGLDVFFTHLSLANPFRHGLFSFQLVSHKLFRWLVPFGLVALLLSNCFLWNEGMFYRICLILQVCLYGSGLLALAVESLARIKPFKLASFFVMGAIATMVAWFKFCSGEKYVTWQPSRRA
jgi:glycosyltransferase involved in cell wall biosynthesis